MTEDDYCQDVVWLFTQPFTCDRLADHEPPHGGVYPGHCLGAGGATIDVRVEWK